MKKDQLRKGLRVLARVRNHASIHISQRTIWVSSRRSDIVDEIGYLSTALFFEGAIVFSHFFAFGEAGPAVNILKSRQ